MSTGETAGPNLLDGWGRWPDPLPATGAQGGRYMGLLVVCAVLMKPTMVDQTPPLALMVKVMTVLIAGWLVVEHVQRRAVVSPALAIYVLYRLSYLPATILNRGDLANWGYVTLAQVSLLLLIERHLRQGSEHARLLLRAVTDLFLVYLLLNYMMILADIHREVSWGATTPQPSYLLGIRTRVTDVVFPAAMTALIHDAAGPRRYGWRTIAVLGLGAAQILTLDVATALIGLVVAALVYAGLALEPRGRGLLSMRAMTVAGVVVSVLVVGMRVQERMAGILEGVLDKSVDLTGRTDIWDAALPILARSPLIGYGVNHVFGAFVPGAGLPNGGEELWQAHNQYLQLLHDGGLLTLGAFLLLMWTTSTAMDTSPVCPRVRAAITAVYGAMAVMSVTETYLYNMGLIILIPFLAGGIGALADQEGARP